jgi:ankyrin repeat protein
MFVRYYKLASWIGESQALVAAAKAGDRSVVSSLLMQGADPNSVQSTSPLAAAARGGHHQCVLLLRMSGADPSVAVARKHLQPDAKGAEDESKEDPNERVPPVVIARENGHQSIVELLEHDAICGECAKPMTVNEAKRCAKCKVRCCLFVFWF